MKLFYLGETDFGYPLYENENGKLFVNTVYRLSNIDGLCTLSGNSEDGEPNISLKSFYQGDVEFIGEPDQRERIFKQEYRLLGRLESDCKYFLGNGRGYVGHLWAGSVKKQIAKMEELWNCFPDDLKPEWITLEQIRNYEAEMMNFAG